MEILGFDIRGLHMLVSMDLIGKLSRKDLVIGLPKLNYIKDKILSKGQASKVIFLI